MKRMMVFAIVILLLFGINCFPLKLAVIKLPTDRQDYILVKQQQVTGFDWYIVGDNSGLFELTPDILLYGNIPNYGFTSGVYQGHNTFICFGEYQDDVEVDGQQSKSFHVDAWNIVYPIKRGGLRPEFINPKYGTNVWDFLD
jgi:hypothetical protein